MAGSLSMQGQQTAIPSGTNNIGPFSIPLGSAEGGTGITTSTTTTFAVPSGANGVLLSPSGFTAGTITLKGVTGDTGFGISNAQPTLVEGVTGNLVIVTAAMAPTGASGAVLQVTSI